MPGYTCPMTDAIEVPVADRLRISSRTNTDLTAAARGDGIHSCYRTASAGCREDR